MWVDYAQPGLVVATQWVADRLADNDPNMRVIEVAFGPGAIADGHLPGAVVLEWAKHLQARPGRDIPSQTMLESVLGGAGITGDTTLILYGDQHNWFAAYAYWLLKGYGHRKLRLMNVGKQKWRAEGRPLTTARSTVRPARYQATPFHREFRAVCADVRASLPYDGKVLLDVRSPAEFAGKRTAPPEFPDEGAQRAGHIPRAINLPWNETVGPDLVFKSQDELTRLYTARGVTADKEIITYCRIGERSAHTWFVLHELLGYCRVRNYDGSWAEWGNMIGAPIEVEV